MKLPSLPFDLDPVAEVSADDVSAFRGFVDRREPVLFLDGARDWPLFQTCAAGSSVEERIQHYAPLLGGRTVRYTATPPQQGGQIGIGPDLRPNFSLNRVASAGEFLDEISDLVANPTGGCVYAPAVDLATLPAIEALVPQPEAFGEGSARLRRVWIGSGAHAVDLHYDQMQNYVTVIEGVKRFSLLPPEALPFIYPAPLNRRVSGVIRSMVTLLDVDREKYPRFDAALEMAQVAVVGPGDTLAIPPLWWHHVESFGFNVMVNMWYPDLDPAIISTAERSMEREVALFAGLDAATTRRFADLQRADPDELTLGLVEGILRDGGATRCAPWTSRRILRTLRDARGSLTALPDTWRQTFEQRYDYYVFRLHGDPYPTVPGALADVARSYRRRHLTRGRDLVMRATNRLRRAADRVRSLVQRP